MKTNGDIWKARAEQLGTPKTSIWKAKEGLTLAKKTGADTALANLMLRHGRLTAEARKYVKTEYPQGVL